MLLQYNNADSTQKSIDSLLEIDPDRSFIIIVVDNASTDGAAQMVSLLYKNEKNIHIVTLDDNLGFAKGNNIGYRIAKEKYDADCIIVSNNDVIFNHSWERKQLEGIIQNVAADIIAPDMINSNGEATNPLMERPVEDPRQIKIKIIIRHIYITFLYIKKKLGISENINLIERIVSRLRKHNVRSLREERYGIVPHGACIVIMKGFIASEEVLFDPRTFMYQEEIIFAYKAKKKGYQILFYPQLKVKHLEGNSTDRNYRGTDKLLFRFINEKKSFQIMLDVMKEL